MANEKDLMLSLDPENVVTIRNKLLGLTELMHREAALEIKKLILDHIKAQNNVTRDGSKEGLARYDGYINGLEWVLKAIDAKYPQESKPFVWKAPIKNKK